MPRIELILDGEGAWPDLVSKKAKGRLIQLPEDALSISALAGGMQSGRASVMIRFDLPDGRTAVAEISLRSLWTVTTAIASRYGEPHMQVQPSSERVKQLEIALLHVGRQLIECQRRHGEPVSINMEAADKEYEQGRG